MNPLPPPPVTVLPPSAPVPGRNEVVMFKLYVDFMAAEWGVPGTGVVREGLLQLMALVPVDEERLRDYYGRRASDLAEFIKDGAKRGLASREQRAA
jgi:hypothetical protein